MVSAEFSVVVEGGFEVVGLDGGEVFVEVVVFGV